MLFTKRPFRGTSASQKKTFKLCNRLWWYTKILGLPEEEKDHFYYGTALHSIAERYFLADETGRDPETGKPVNLYPEGWDEVHDRDGKLAFKYSKTERELIKKQVEQAIANGTWSRQPNCEVEWSPKGGKPVGDTGIKIFGFIDVKNPEQCLVEDHKTAKNARYASTSRKLQKGDDQLLIYAKFLIDELRAGYGSDPKEIHVQHNVFRKDGAEPYVARASYSVEMIEDAWSETIEITKQMKKVAQIDSAADIPDPEPGACMAYGGCSFRSVCGRQESLKTYQKRINRLNANRRVQVERKAKGIKEMGVFDRIKKPSGATKPATSEEETPQDLNPPKREVVATSVEEVKRDQIVAPWGDIECKACGDNQVIGLNTRSKVCRVCNSTLDDREVAESDRPNNYKISDDFTWAVLKRKPVANKEEAAEEPQEAESNPAKAVASKKPAGKSKKVQARSKFTLCYNCSPISMSNPNSNLICGDALFREVQEELAEKEGVSSYYELDPFGRRDTVAKIAPKLAEDLGIKTVVFVGTASPDLKSFVDSLRALAGTVYVGTN